MLVILAGLLALAAAVVLFRLLWLQAGPDRHRTAITLAVAALILGLGVLALTGRLHWLAAAGAALLPFLRRGVGLLRYLPLLRRAFGSAGNGGAGEGGAGGRGRGQRQRARPGTMSREQALEILGLGTRPSREEILAAHRRLIQKLHPDRGGSNYLAQQLNEAKRVLLEDG